MSKHLLPSLPDAEAIEELTGDEYFPGGMSECGGIHPPVDDIPGRVIGETIGTEAYALATQYFAGN